MSDDVKATVEKTEKPIDGGKASSGKGNAGAKAAAKAEGAAPEKASKPAKGEKAVQGEKAAKGEETAQGEKSAQGEKAAKGESAAKGQKAGKGGAGGKGDKKGKGGAAEAFVKRTAAPRLRQKYEADVVPALMKAFAYKNKMAVPRLVKISVNFGLGEALQNQKLIASAEEQMAAITGQKPLVTRARKSIATFKLRQDQPIGVAVTLRRERMYEFFDRLVSIALPRTRDFRGVSPRSFDGRGNMTLGIKEQIVFPEIDYDKIEKIKGLNVCIVTTAKTDEEGRALLRHLGMPFRE